MTTAVGARSSQVYALFPRSAGQPPACVTQLAAMVVYTPPQTRFTRTSQLAAMLPYEIGKFTVPRTSQLFGLIVYATGVPSPKRSRAWTFVLDGHTFYVLDLGTEGTFLYDTVTNQWCNFSTQGFEPQWNFQNGCMWGNRIIGADLLTNDIWEMDPSAVLDEGWRDIAHLVTGGISTRSRVYVANDAVRVSSSIGQLDEVNGSTMLLRYSDDQEETWSDYFEVDLIPDDFDGEIAYRSLGSFMAPGRIFELSDSGGLLRIDGADAFLNGFDNDQENAGD